MPPPDFEALLRHRPFVRRLARRLMGDDAGADDLVQDTYVTALENPPRHDGALRAWLATIARKLAWTRQRGARRRAAHERAATPPSPDPSPEDLLERAQWHQRLVNLVMQLDEPYRSTVLLRYFEDRNSAEIARVQGVPAATVRTRLKRALEQVRERLDKEDGGRAAWMAGLALLALPRGAAPAAPAGGLKLAGALAAAGAGLLAVAGLVAVLEAGRMESGERAPARPDFVPPPETPRPAEEAADEGDGSPLTVTVLADARPVADARVWLLRRAVEDWRPTPYEAWRPWREGVTGTAGRATWHGVPPGYVRVLAHAPGRGRAEGFAHLPIGLDAPVVLELPPGEPVDVAVRDDATGEPVAGATVRLTDALGWPWLPGVEARTGREGRAAPEGAGAEGLAVAADGFDPWRGPVTGDTLDVRLVPRRRTVRWAIAGPGPPDGTALLLRRIYDASADPARARVEGGEIVAEGLPEGLLPEMLAVAPDGSFARVAAEPGDRRGAPVHFSAPVPLEVVVRDDRGTPVAGVDVQLFRTEGNVAVRPGGRTGPDGLLRLPVYANEVVDVRVRTATHAPFHSVGSFDPRRGPGRVEGAVAAGRPVVVRCRPWPLDVDVFVGAVRLAPEEVEAGGGTLRFTVRAERPGEPAPAYLLAPGFVPATLDVDPRGDGVAELDVDLAPGGALVLHVVPAGQPYRLALAQGDDTAALRRGPWEFRLYAGPDHVVRESMLPPGRYRVRDLVSGAETPEFEVAPGRPAVDLRLALPDPTRPTGGPIAGTVEGFRSGTEVVAVVAGRRLVLPVAPDGTFRFDWSGEGVATLWARHPVAGPGPPVTCTEPGEGVVLRLTPAHRAFVRLAPAPAASRPGETEPTVLRGRAGIRLDAVLEGDRLAFTGYAPGRADLWIDVPGFAPRRLADVDLGEGETDLGTADLAPGSTLRFQVLGRDREALPALLLVAQAEGPPRYQRSVATEGGARAELKGLGEGAFRVGAWDRLTGRPVWTKRVVVDGVSPVDLDLDLR